MSEWTNTPPIKAGWYWVFEPDEDDPIQFAEIGFETNGKFVAWKTGIEHDIPLSHFTHWLGPIPKPNPPPVDT